MAAASPSGSRGARKKRGFRWRVRKLRNAAGRRLGQRFGAFALRRLWGTCRRTVLHDEHRLAALESSGAFVLVFWHGRGVLASPFHDPRTVDVLVSASEDGSMATTMLARLGYHIIRGSSSKYGVRALREMIATLKTGKNVAITPDGPRGPMHAMSPGVVFMAKVTGLPVLPMGLASSAAWHLDTWDHYTVPKPGSELVACYGEPLAIPRRASPEEVAQASRLVQERLREAEREAFRHLGRDLDWGAWARDAPPVLEP